MIEEKKKRLKELIKDMDLPENRKDQTFDVSWLTRNMGIRNANHPNFPEALQICKWFLKFG